MKFPKLYLKKETEIFKGTHRRYYRRDTDNAEHLAKCFQKVKVLLLLSFNGFVWLVGFVSGQELDYKIVM